MILAPKKYIGKVAHVEWANERDILLTISLVDPSIIEFDSGQFINLKVNDVNYRSYSICSDRDDVKNVTIVASSSHNGLGANYIRSLKIGDGVEFIGSSGRFALRYPLSEEIVFVCTGTGIAPVISMLFKLSTEKCVSRIRLYFGIRSKRQMLFSDLLKSFKRELTDFDYKICVSDKEALVDKSVYGRVTEHFAIDSPSLAQIYLCGHPEMVTEMIKKLSDIGVSSDRVFHEKFTVNSVGTVKF